MFGFGKKQAKAPEDRISELEKKKDWAGLAKACYELGVTAMDAGELNRAQLWLHRADTIYSADDAVYGKVGDRIIDDCSDRIGRLEDEEGLLYHAVPAQVEERAGELNDPQVRAELERIWSDFDFVRSDFGWEQTEERISAYRQLDILAK